jgi:hypothetical protein
VINEIVSGGFLFPVHPHIQKMITPETESPFRVIQLMGRYAKIKENSVHFRNTNIRKNMGHGGKIRLPENYPGSERNERFAGFLNGLSIPVQTNQQTRGADCLQNTRGMSSSAQGTVNKNTAGPATKTFHYLPGKYGRMIRTHSFSIPRN